MQHHHSTTTAPPPPPPSLPFPPLSSFALPSMSSTPILSTSTSSPTSYDTSVTSTLTRATPTSLSSMSQVSSPSSGIPTYSDIPHAPMSAITDARYSSYPTEMYALGDHQGYIRILPRTSATSALYKKRCETCATTHDGSFGAGRFCSSRCARTVGGLAHRKKRMMERDAKQRSAAEHRAKIKKRRHSFDRDTSLTDEALAQLSHDAREAASCADSARSPRSVITINSLLNPAES